MAKWPTTITEEFWPFALFHACTFHNASIRHESGLSPHRMFTGEDAPWRVEHFHVFGSLVFVLHKQKQLQYGDSLPK
jgi:hypothetical protein